MKGLRLALGLLFVAVLKSSDAQIPITAGTYFPPNTELTEDGVPVLDRRYSRGDAVHYPGPQGLDHYTNFVNDPYVSTEDLGSIISTRPRPAQRPRQRPQVQQPRPRRPELRSGPESYSGDRIRWSAPFQPNQPPSSSSSYSRSSSSYTQSPQEPSGRYRSNSNTYNTRSYTRHGGSGNDEWEVADKSDNHITYRRRVTTSRQPWNNSPPPVQRFETRQGQVSARVVDMRSNDGDYYRRQHVGATTNTNTPYTPYTPPRSQPQTRQRPETRSLEYNPSIFPTNTRSATGNSNVDAYWQQRRQGTSSGSSSAWPNTSGTSGSTYYDRRPEPYSAYGAQTAGQYQYRPAAPRFEPNYPILNDKETAGKAGVPNTVVITV